MLTDFVKWASLTKSVTYLNKSKYHYKTIADIHKLWSDSGIYLNAYKECIDKNIINCLNNQTIELFIDSTLIINKSGVQSIDNWL